MVLTEECYSPMIKNLFCWSCAPELWTSKMLLGLFSPSYMGLDVSRGLKLSISLSSNESLEGTGIEYLFSPCQVSFWSMHSKLGSGKIVMCFCLFVFWGQAIFRRTECSCIFQNGCISTLTAKVIWRIFLQY